MSYLTETEERFHRLAPAGFYVGLRVGFSFPSEELNCLPEAWVDFYTSRGLVVHDPVMRWIYTHRGVARFASLGLLDPMSVLSDAAGFGLTYGAAVSVLAPAEHGRRSYGQFYRSDRDFDERELGALLGLMEELHADSAAARALTAAEVEALRLQSRGLRLKQIAAELGISMSAVKARLASAKRKLGAQTPSQAALIASNRGIL